MVLQEDQLRLERGETEVLDYTPTTTSIEDVFVDTSINSKKFNKIDKKYIHIAKC